MHDLKAIIREVGGRYGLADLVKVRARLAGLDRRQQDEAINQARRLGLVTATAYEGRKGLTPEQRAAGIEDGLGGRLGYLSIRED